jgi:hypothetical protein
MKLQLLIVFTCGALSEDTHPHHRLILAITCLSVTSAKYSDCPVQGTVTPINLQWAELHLRPLEGVVETSPGVPVNAVIRGGPAVVVQRIQVGGVGGTGHVPPGALARCST